MSEIYLNYTDEQIQELIKYKLEIYPKDFPIWKADNVRLSNNFFVLRYYAKYHNLDISKCEIVRYIAMYEGVELYNFYNIKQK